jgi:hypothetical protein
MAHSGKHSGKPSPSQELGIEKIRSYFEQKRSEPLEKFEVRFRSGSGTVDVVVETDGDFVTKECGFFSIGRSGKITVERAVGMLADKNHYARMLSGKVE